MATHPYGQCKIVVENDTSRLAHFQQTPDSFKRKCKIICTMGPSSYELDMLPKLIDAGMNIARLNFSFGDHERHAKTVANIREACKRRPDRPVAIMLDTKGPEIRSGCFREDVGTTVELKKGQDFKLVTDYTFRGDSSCVALSYQALPTTVKPGNRIFMAEGSVSLTVKECGKDFVMTEVLKDCKLGERKSCNLPGVKVQLPVLQDKDKDDLINFAIPQSVDFVAASFVQGAEDVKLIRQTLGLRGRSVKIISKIENEEGLRNFDAIAQESDGIMVARGDLGMEIPAEKVFLAQKMIIARCNVMGKPVVTATQMLESMTDLPRPTRAEASDVANAVLDGTDCVMLSGETAAGRFPLNAVTVMRRICEESERVIEYNSLHASLRQGVLAKFKHLSPVESICSSAVKATIDMGSNLIVALTESGHTARIIAKYRPKATILAIAASESTVRQLQCVRGVVPMLTASFVGTDSVIAKALARAKSDGMARSGDVVVCVHGQREECPGHSNLLKMVTVP